VETDPLTGRVPLQPPEAAQFCAPLAFQVNVTGSPELTLLGLNCKEIDGLAAEVVAAPDESPLPPGVKESPSQAANADTNAKANTQREAPATIRRVDVVHSAREAAGRCKAELRTDRGLRPLELIRNLHRWYPHLVRHRLIKNTCHNGVTTVITSGSE
jgi:hypothetical protein